MFAKSVARSSVGRHVYNWGRPRVVTLRGYAAASSLKVSLNSQVTILLYTFLSLSLSLTIQTPFPAQCLVSQRNASGYMSS